jgi:hypothetical protein
MPKRPPTQDLRPPPLSVDPEKFPSLSRNPALERALRIRQALQRGRPREEAVALAEQAMGPRGKRRTARRPDGKPSARASEGTAAKRPAAATRKTGKAAAPRARR